MVFDSFSGYVDSLLETARKTKKNFDIWNMYNEEVGKLLYLVKKYPKDIIVSAHSNNVESVDGIAEKRIAVKGKEWNIAGIESKFTIVVFSEVKRDSMTNKPSYIFELNSDGITTAKTPPMFVEGEATTVPNDANALLTTVRHKLSNG